MMELINLQRLSSMKISSLIWEKPEIKRQITELFESRPAAELKIRDLLRERTMMLPNFVQDKGRKRIFNLIIDSALQSLDSTELPLELKTYCKDVILEMGEKIFDWTEYVADTLRINLKFAGIIFWTPLGTLDERRILREWENDQEFSNERCAFDSAPLSFILACVNAQEDFIMNNLNEMERIIKILEHNFNLNDYDDKLYTIMAVFLYFHITRYSVTNAEIDHSHLTNEFGYIIPPSTMLELCASACFPRAVYYFWNVLKKHSEENEEILLKIAKNCLAESNHFMRTSFKKDKLAEVIVFLINQMSVDQRNEFIQRNLVKIIRRIFPVWPFNEIILPFISEYSSSLSVADFKSLFLFIQILITESKRESKIKYYRLVFEKIFEISPLNLREDIFCNENRFLSMYHHLFDINCLIFVLSALDNASKFEIIKDIRPRLLLLAKDGNTGLLNQFYKKVLRSADERDEFKDYILKSIDDFLKNLLFGPVDKLLNYFSSSSDERAVLKNKINSLAICEFLVVQSWKYDGAEKFLEWMFYNEEEREKFRNNLDVTWFICERTSKYFDEMLGILKKIEEDQNLLSHYSQFFFGFPEEIKWLKNKEDFFSIRQHCAEIFIQRFYSNYTGFVNYDSKVFSMYVKWVCKDEERREGIGRNYRNDEERQMFVKIIEALLEYSQKVLLVSFQHLS